MPNLTLNKLCAVWVVIFALWAASTLSHAHECYDSGNQAEAHGVKSHTQKRGLPEGMSANDWSSIRAAYEAGRHCALPAQAGFTAVNPGQGWQIEFDGRGFLVRPELPDWSWGLELRSYGFEGFESEFSESLAIDADANRIAVDWDGHLEEWYINDGRGLEHGFNLNQRPAAGQAAGRLRLRLAVRGGLAPKVDPDRRGIAFLTQAGETALRYQGLVVFDADGKQLDAGFEIEDQGLLLSIDEAGARYPLTIDPVAQQAYLKASNPSTHDDFGLAVAYSGNTVIVGARSEDTDAAESGAAYIFVRSGSTWTQQAMLKASNPGGSDSFGFSVALSGNTAVIGAYVEASSASGVNGNQADDSMFAAGAAYVFVRSGTTWSQEAYLKASNTEAGDTFGWSVAVSGNTAIVGANGEDSDATGVNGNQMSNAAFGSGAAYVFVRSGTTWTQQAYLKASNAGVGAEFGYSVAIEGKTAIIGAQGERSDATGVNGDQFNEDAVDSGAAFVFVRTGTIWSQEAYLKASNTDAGDSFGTDVDLSGDTAIVGARVERSTATGVNGDQTINMAARAGAAYIFVRAGTTWSQEAYLKASNTEGFDDFGKSVAISDNTAIVGAHNEDSNASGVDGDQTDNSASASGAVYGFVRTGSTWSQAFYLKASSSGSGDTFGEAVDMSGDSIIVGASGEDSNATGVNGDQANNDENNAGAAYALDLGLDPWTDLGGGTNSISSAPYLEMSGTLEPNSALSLSLTQAPPFSLFALVISSASTPVGLVGGTFHATPSTTFLLRFTNAAGAFSIPNATWPVGIPAGIPTWYQFYCADAESPFGATISNAVMGTTP